jgi:hypothetical protein
MQQYVDCFLHAVQLRIAQETLNGRDGSLKVSGVTTAGAAQTWTIPVANIDNYYQNYANVTQNMVYDASFGRLRQLSLGYTMPAKLISKTPFESVSVSIVGRNLAMLEKRTQYRS